MTIKCYSELITLPTFKERFNYLRLKGSVGEATFQFNRYLNQSFYRSAEWKRIRNEIIVRDNGCDLGCDGYEIHRGIIIHHINPISIDDILKRRSVLFDPENLISTVHLTHNAIHYGDESLLMVEPIERSANDTCPWK